jgi:hypothetical protein
MKYFRRARFWLSYIFGGNFNHPHRGEGWQPSLWRMTLKWKLETFKGEYTWWEFCKPPSKNVTPAFTWERKQK